MTEVSIFFCFKINNNNIKKILHSSFLVSLDSSLLRSSSCDVSPLRNLLRNDAVRNSPEPTLRLVVFVSDADKGVFR